MSDRDSSTSKGPMTKRLKIDNNSKTKMKKMVKAMSSKPMKNKMDDTKVNFSHLENLPNEILLKIFHYMNPKIKELLSFGQVSRRIRSVANDHSFWENVNLFPKNTVPTGLLQLILENGCKRLSTCSQILGTLTLNQESQLKFLNTAWNTDSRVLTVLLGSCNSLEQLRLSNVVLNPDMISSICRNGQTLKVLKMNHCQRFSEGLFSDDTISEWIQPIIDNCSELSVLDLCDTPLSEESIDYVAKNVTPKISKLTIYGMPFRSRLFTTNYSKFDLISKRTLYCHQIIELLEDRCNNLNGQLNVFSLMQNFGLSNIEDVWGNINRNGLLSWRDIVSTFRRYE